MAIESLEEFYQHKFNWMPENLKKDVGHFNVFNLEDWDWGCNAQIQYNRRDFYKISIMRGKHVYHYADKSLEVDGTTLMFFNPSVPYKYEKLTTDSTGFFCIFKEAFFNEVIRGDIKELPMFQIGAKPAYLLNEEQDKQVDAIFRKMMTEMGADYTFKFDLIRNYIMEIVHTALKMDPSESLYQNADANARITAVFSDLLERQFPIETPSQQLRLRSASDYASSLNVHTNHLNRAVRLTTGKTTTAHIAERVAAEAKALLLHTDWNISQISYCLGFDEPAHFNHFFKKQTSTTPSAFRL
ncbi:helix-turn-helix domain-containing protein [Dyadobacter crusticola]|uniref:helix-turn-helix domain-containing protein n=1 Tax=Dyadobacter crusticola TaxID=292407 RepID=UPI0004E120F3|nr:AraC family transcriptional regulator [Dyadobacter crusticola]